MGLRYLPYQQLVSEKEEKDFFKMNSCVKSPTTNEHLFHTSGDAPLKTITKPTVS